MHKKLLLNVGLFVPLSIVASIAPSRAQEYSYQANTNRQIENLAQEIAHLKKNLAKNEAVHTKKIEELQDALSKAKRKPTIHENSKSVAYEMVLQLKPYEIIGEFKALYEIDKNSIHIRKARQVLHDAGLIDSCSSAPTINQICESSDKLTALSQAKTLLDVYKKNINL